MLNISPKLDTYTPIPLNECSTRVHDLSFRGRLRA